MDGKLIRARSKISGNPRPELGVLTEGAEYLVPKSLFDDEVFSRVEPEKAGRPTKQKKEEGN